MSALSARLHQSSFYECQQAANEIDSLEAQVEVGRVASLAMHCMTQSALTRGYDRICDAIAAAPVKSTGSGKW